jgi:hypothetical protein
MGTEADEDVCSASTRWVWKRVKIDPPLAAPPRTAAAGVRRKPVSRWDPRTALTLSVRYRGGAEGWYEVRARGRTIRVPGHVSMHDVMRDIYGER